MHCRMGGFSDRVRSIVVTLHRGLRRRMTLWAANARLTGKLRLHRSCRAVGAIAVDEC